MQHDALLTICLMSFNQGARALNIVQQLQPQLDEQVRLLVLDNGSSQETPQYQQIQALSERDTRIRYLRHPGNRGKSRNYLACFTEAATPYIGDAFTANVTMIREILPLLQQYPGVGIMRGSVGAAEQVADCEYRSYSDDSYLSGTEAMLAFYLENDCVSGTIYHRQLLLRQGVIQLLERHIDDYGVSVSPQWYFDLLAAAVSDVVTTKQISAWAIGNRSPTKSYASPYAFGSCVDQFVTFRNNLLETMELVGQTANVPVFAALYLKLAEKYFYLIATVNAELYVDNRIHPGLMLQSMHLLCLSAIQDYEDLGEFRAQIIDRLHALKEKYDCAISNGDSADSETMAIEKDEK
jgi:glycosyltransferase involved in cell wall biosynthesis